MSIFAGIWVLVALSFLAAGFYRNDSEWSIGGLILLAIVTAVSVG